MGFTWSEDQLKVINLRNRDILVSAAAGSGKTTVLVERIIRMICDPTNPIDIDQLLVLTFTKAAAGEMKERIGKALEERLESNPDDPNLLKQSTLVQHAMITTIDSFCLFVVRNYFEEINLDPNFRVADEVEVELLSKDILNEIFEEYYKKEDKQFLDLIDAYADSRSDEAVRKMVEAVYKTSRSAPWPRKWMEGLRNTSDVEQELAFFLEYSKPIVESAIMQAQALIERCRKSDIVEHCIPAFEADIELFNRFLELQTFEEACDYFANLKYTTMPSKRNMSEEDKDKKDKLVIKPRKKYKDSLDELKKNYYSLRTEDVKEQQDRLMPYINMIITLALTLDERIAEQKNKRHMLDFSDMEHFALSILVDEETNEPRPVAEVFRKQFKEIMIDEYQDSNDVQETILKAISGHSIGKYNMFMVGDVKQSIYRFRMANPDLFMGKYHTYSLDDSDMQRIDLQCNYRSRKGVLDFANEIFYSVMRRDLGGVEYDDAAALYYGADYLQSEEPCAEVLAYNYKDLKEELGEDAEDDKIVLEARMVANRILQLKKTMQVQDKQTKQFRPAEYRDIVILLRSISTAGPLFVETLQQYGIPAHVDSTTGYFNAVEVQVILNLLSLIDNPYQDIPMALVLKSPIGGYTDEDLAEIRVNGKGEQLSFAELAMRHLKENEMPFYDLLTELRGRKDLAVHEMIQLIFERTGYDRYVAALPGGKTRYANLITLVEKAIKFESTSYKGIFQFMRYIMQMRKYEKDFGEADAEGESGDIVHIKTIHKSKGLEYPIVFVSCLGKEFNTMDEKNKMIVHQKLGIGLSEATTTPRVKKNTVMKNVISKTIHNEMLAEEMRVLYVALTRAKEKLILTGKFDGEVNSEGQFDLAQRMKAKTYMDWILPALYSRGLSDFVHWMDVEDFAQAEEVQIEEKTLELQQIYDKIDEADQEKIDQIRKIMEYEYPYQREISRKSKYSVSEIKHDSMKARYDSLDEAVEPASFLKEEREVYIPSFAQEKPLHYEKPAAEMIVIPAGALFGTAVHRMMELLDFAAFASVDRTNYDAIHQFAEAEKARIYASSLFEDELKERLYGNELETFLHSEVAGRMAEAAARGELYRERPFVMSMEDGALVQGIIDVFWKEEDGIVLLDYKTDRVEKAEELILRYQDQLLLYKDALERLFGTVKSTLIYSYRLKEVLTL